MRGVQGLAGNLAGPGEQAAEGEVERVAAVVSIEPAAHGKEFAVGIARRSGGDHSRQLFRSGGELLDMARSGGRRDRPQRRGAGEFLMEERGHQFQCLPDGNKEKKEKAHGQSRRIGKH